MHAQIIIGYEEIECHSFLGNFFEKMKNACNEEIESEQNILDHAKNQVTSKLKEYIDYCKQLGRVPVVSMEGSGSGLGNNYADKLAELDRLMNSIITEVSQRSKLLNIEFLAIDELVTSMGEIPPKISIFSGPEGTPELSDLRLHLLRQYKAELDVKKSKRIEEMKEIAKECHASIEDLVIVASNSSNSNSRDKFSDCDDAIITYGKTSVLNMGIHANDLELLKLRNTYLLEEKTRRRNELASTGAEIARLWTILRIPTAEREQFQSSFKMNLSLETINKGKEEVQRLQDIRATSLSRVINSIRSDICLLWDEAGIESTEKRKDEFPDYFQSVDDLDDSSVDVHEAYYHKIKSHVEELRPILQKIARRESVVVERIELEHIQLNPERLTARGPNAREDRKKEESMTTRVKNLEKNTKELMILIQAWEEINGSFIYAEERYADRVIQQELNYIEVRDNLRNSRKDKKKDSTASSSSISTSTGGKAIDSSAAIANIAKLNGIRKFSMSGGSLSSSISTNFNNGNSSSLSSSLKLSKDNIILSDKMNHQNQENMIIDRNSTGSDGSDVTSATEISPRYTSTPSSTMRR